MTLKEGTMVDQTDLSGIAGNQHRHFERCLHGSRARTICWLICNKCPRLPLLHGEREGADPTQIEIPDPLAEISRCFLNFS